MALSRLAEFLFAFLIESQKAEPAAIAPILLRDYRRGGRNDLPPFLRAHVEPIPGEAKPRPASAKRQGRHAGIPSALDCTAA